MASWRPSISFCIITNGAKPDHLRALIASIHDLNIQDFEILVAGRPPEGLTQITTIQLPQAADNGQLGAMRNACCQVAKNELLVVSDDDMRFEKNFYEGICTFGPNFDVLCCKLLNTDGSRFFDWAVIGGPTGQHLIAYDETSPYLYVTGGLAILKPSVYAKVQWDPTRGFYNQEDVDFSTRLKSAGFKISFNPHSTVAHVDDNYTQIDKLVMRADYCIDRANVLIPGVGYREGFLKGEGNLLVVEQSLIYFDPLQSDSQLSFNAMAVALRQDAAESNESVFLSVGSGNGPGADILLRTQGELVPVSATLARGIDHIWVRIKNVSQQPIHFRQETPLGAGIMDFALSGVNPASRPKPPKIADNGRVLIFSSLFDFSEVSRAVRSTLLQENVPARVALKLLRGHPLIEANLSKVQSEISRAFALDSEHISRAAIIHDGSFVVGSNFYRANDSRWSRSLFIGPENAVDQSMIDETTRGNLLLATFSGEDFATLLSRGVPRSRVSLVPLVPRRVATGNISRPMRNVLIPFAYHNMPTVQVLSAELAVFLQKMPDTVAFFFLADLKSQIQHQTQIQEHFARLGLGARIKIFGGVVPDALLDEVFPQMDIALCLGESDPFGYFVRELLALQIPVAATLVGARRDITTSGLVAIEQQGHFAETVLTMASRLDSLRAECRKFAAELSLSPALLDSIEKVLPA